MKDDDASRPYVSQYGRNYFAWIVFERIATVNIPAPLAKFFDFSYVFCVRTIIRSLHFDDLAWS